jgi:hypothetical protein
LFLTCHTLVSFSFWRCYSRVSSGSPIPYRRPRQTSIPTISSTTAFDQAPALHHVGQSGSSHDYLLIYVRGANGSAVSRIPFYSSSPRSVWELKIGRMSGLSRRRLTIGAYSKLLERPSHEQNSSHRVTTSAPFEIRQSEAYGNRDNERYDNHRRRPSDFTTKQQYACNDSTG